MLVISINYWQSPILPDGGKIDAGVAWGNAADMSSAGNPIRELVTSLEQLPDVWVEKTLYVTDHTWISSLIIQIFISCKNIIILLKE